MAANLGKGCHCVQIPRCLVGEDMPLIGDKQCLVQPSPPPLPPPRAVPQRHIYNVQLCVLGREGGGVADAFSVVYGFARG